MGRGGLRVSGRSKRSRGVYGIWLLFFYNLVCLTFTFLIRRGNITAVTRAPCSRAELGVVMWGELGGHPGYVDRNVQQREFVEGANALVLR